MKKLTASVALLFGLTFCASVGRPFDTTHVHDIKKGAQTKEQIVAWFGQPQQVQSPLAGHPSGCVERWQWTYAHSVAGASTVSESLVVDFDGDGKVCDNAYSKVNQ